MDEFKRHFRSGAEHGHHCDPILAEKIARKVAAEKLAEEAEYDPNLPADNYEVLSKERLAELSENKRRKREEAMKTHGSLLVKPEPNRSSDDLCRVPWQGKDRLLSEDTEVSRCPTSPVGDTETTPLSPSSPPPSSPPSSPSLEALPFPVLKHIGMFLDPRDLSALALTSRFLRRICSSLLQECGMVTFSWERQVDDSWVVTQKVGDKELDIEKK